MIRSLLKKTYIFGYEYCAICGRPLRLNEEDICDECFFETSKPLTDEEIKVIEQSNDD